MKIIEKKLTEISLYENNPRKNDKAVDYVANSIKEFGFKVPIIIDKDGVIIAGHTRYKASVKLGLEKVPCIIADDLTEDQVKAFRLADNKVGEIAEWDTTKLEEELSAIELDMSNFGFNLEDYFEKEAEDDEFDKEDVPPRTQLGQIWKLGNHRLMCGDSTDLDTVKKLMDGKLSDLCLTDPPYNIDYEGGTGMKIKNDNMSNDEFLKFLVAAFKNMKEVLKPGGGFYIWHADNNAYTFRLACIQAELEVRQCLVWNKSSITLGRQDYQWKHEPCLYGWKEGAAHYFVEDRTQATVINEDKPSKSDLHPTMKPIKLLARQIKNSSRLHDLVLDLFGGSGSTLIACEQLDRTCYMMEYDPHYCDVIIDRWEEYTHKKAELVN